MKKQALYRPWTTEDAERTFEQIVERGARRDYEGTGGGAMKRKLMTITYTCLEDKINLGESDIMGYILQKLGELGAYDISIKASSTNIIEQVTPKIPELDIKIPEFMQKKHKPLIETIEVLDARGKLCGRYDEDGKKI